MAETCLICHTKRPKRFCPAISGDICPLCCGDQREVNISCPLDCTYLREARQHERPAEFDPEALPHKEISVKEEFVYDHEELVLFCLFTLTDSALRTPGAVDSDLLNAIDALIRTYRTAESGLIYETRPEDKIAAAVQDEFTGSMAELQKQRSAQEGLSPFRDTDVMRALVFAQRYLLMERNGRPRGRAFIDFVQRRLAAQRPETMMNLAR